ASESALLRLLDSTINPVELLPPARNVRIELTELLALCLILSCQITELAPERRQFFTEERMFDFILGELGRKLFMLGIAHRQLLQLGDKLVDHCSVDHAAAFAMIRSTCAL